MTEPTSPPPLPMPPGFRERLSTHGEEALQAFEAYLETAPRACARLVAKRVSDTPLKRGAISRLFGGKVAAPTLGPLASKFGGTPYQEGGEDWSTHEFVLQINFADTNSTLLKGPAKGLLAIDLEEGNFESGFRLRFYPEPSEDAFSAPDPLPPSKGKFECKVNFKTAYTLPPGHGVDELPQDPALRGLWLDAEIPAAYRGGDDHQLLGHKNQNVFNAKRVCDGSGREVSPNEQELLLQLSFDSESGLTWGSNVVYVLIDPDALAKGALNEALVTVANY